MESKTRVTAGYSLAASLRVRRLAPAVGATLAQDSRGPVQITNETLTIPISDSAEVSLCASA